MHIVYYDSRQKPIIFIQIIIINIFLHFQPLNIYYSFKRYSFFALNSPLLFYIRTRNKQRRIFYKKIECIFGKFLSDITRLYIPLHNCVHLELQIHFNRHNTVGAFPGVGPVVKLLLGIKQN